MIKIEPCIGCGRIILQHRIANLVVKCEPTPIANVGDIVKLLSAPNPPGLWMVERNQAGQPSRLRGARAGELGVVPEHHCAAATRVSDRKPPAGHPQPAQASPSISEAESVLGGPARPGDASTAPFSTSRRINTPRCDGCSRPCADGTYASIQLGDLTVWAHHVTTCEGR